MKVASYKKDAGRKGKEKIHEVNRIISAGYQRNGLTGAVIPGGILTMEFDGRIYLIELDKGEVDQLFESIKKTLIMNQ